ncbi:MAG: MlaD family protein, partial [Flavobacteriaceae bacterium]|nr:MlaD family protein [Flavobacteriaceae bacterium]
MKKSAPEKIKLGMFVVIGTLLLISALYFIGNRQNLFTQNIKIYSYFRNVNGLQTGNNVRYSGINVGTVSKTDILSDTLIRVEMLIEEKMNKFIRKNAVATIGSDGLVGSMIVNIIPAEGTAERIASGDIIQSYSKIGMNDMLTTLNVTNENAALLTSDLLKITSNINQGKGTLGMLISDSTLAIDLKQTLLELKKTSVGASKSMASVNEMIASVNFSESVAGFLLSDTLSTAKMRNILNNLEQSSQEITQVTENLNALLSEIKDGQGTLHYLTQDPALVRDLDSTMQNIKEGTARFNENMEALKHNFLLRGYFKKLEKEQRKAQKKSS